ncbi:MAG: hypothetical protein RLZZ135_2698 [Cyanobacteriota bacterium]|jgi:hypothetical protein
MRHYNRSRRTDLFTQNLIWIGYHAWQGYLTDDRGLVVISSDVGSIEDADYLWEARSEPNLNFRYIPQLQLSLYLEEWLVPVKSIESISSAVASYQPETELVFANESGVQLDIGWCQRLKTLPPDCYQQICRRWSEFELGVRG